MDKVKTITNNNEWKLVGEFGLFQEILHTLWIVAIGFTAYSLNLKKVNKINTKIYTYNHKIYTLVFFL